ncbi:MAG: class I SAM-dependent methyltransferase, partial [Chloroflexi bacterium]|nr:class I SAM-dependent methyltransferase [Chloroflexota bacterium]
DAWWILAAIVLGIPLLVVLLHTAIRIVRKFHKFPIPQFLADLIDNPLRRRIQPPDETAVRHGLEPGMTVLEVGPGNGTYTLAAARRAAGQAPGVVGDGGQVVTIDIEPRMIERVERRIQAEGITNVEARVADVYDLPFDDGTFDLVYMIAVIGEIPEPERAMHEFYRVLSPSGTLVFSEVLLDPDYPLVQTVSRWAASAGFRLRKRLGNYFYYTLIWEKDR